MADPGITPLALLHALRMRQSRWDDSILEFNGMSVRAKLELLYRMCIELGEEFLDIHHPQHEHPGLVTIIS